MIAITTPFSQYYDIDGKPLNSGFIYFGVAGQNPETNPVTVYWDAAGTQPAAQPIRTLNGLPARSGTPALLFIGLDDYSMTVRNRHGRLIFTLASAAQASPTLQLKADMANTADAARGAGMLGFNYALNYAAGTIGRWLKDLALSTGATFIGWIRSATGAVLRTLAAKLNEGPLTPEDFGAVGDGVTDDYVAVSAMITQMTLVGGHAALTAGKTYYLNSTVVINQTNPVNWKLTGWGSTIKSGPAVTGYALQITNSFNEFMGEIEGLYFNHRGNTTAQGCIELKGAHCITLRRNAVEFHSVKAEYAFIHLDTINPGISEDDYNSFWITIEKNSTRKRSGSDPGTGKYGIKITGAANAARIRDNVFGHVDYGVYGEPAGTTKALANDVLIEGNAFEGLTTAVHVQMNPGTLGPTGWRVAFNRVETTTNFFSMATGGAVATIHSQPPFLFANYCTTGSVTNWIVNPTGYPISVFETRYPGFGPTVDNKVYQAGHITFVFDTGKMVYLQDSSGSAGYNTGRINYGAISQWVNPGDGKWYTRSGTPTTPTDGTVIGTQT